MLRQFFGNSVLAAGAQQVVGWGTLQGSQFQDQNFLMCSGISDQPGQLTFYESDDTKTAAMTRVVAQIPVVGGVRFNLQATIRCMSWQVIFVNLGGQQSTFELAVDSSTNPPVNFDSQGNLLVNISASAAAAVPSSTVDPINANQVVPFFQWLALEQELLIEVKKQNMLLVWLGDKIMLPVAQGTGTTLPVELSSPTGPFASA